MGATTARRSKHRGHRPCDPPVKVVIVGAGFADFYTARRLLRLVPAGAVAITLVTPDDYLLYSPLLPEVASGVVDPVT